MPVPKVWERCYISSPFSTGHTAFVSTRMASRQKRRGDSITLQARIISKLLPMDLKAQETANLFVSNLDNLGCSCSPTLSVEFPGRWYVLCFFDRSTVATKSLREIIHTMYYESNLSFWGAAGKGWSRSKSNKAHFLSSRTGGVCTFGYTGLNKRTRWFVSLLLHVSRNLFLGETSTISQWNPWGTQGSRSSLDACHGKSQSSWSWKPS